MKAINLDGQNEYNIEEVDGDYFIYYSLSEQWNLDTRGTLAFKVVNTGNGFKITQEYKGKLNYSESFCCILFCGLSIKIIILKLENLKNYNYGRTSKRNGFPQF